MKKYNLIFFSVLIVIFIAGCELTTPVPPKPGPIPNTSGWTQMHSNTSKNLAGVWGTSATNVYAVSTDGDVQRYNGTTWAKIYHISPEQGSTLTINCIWAYPPNYIFVGGYEQVGPDAYGMVVWYNGTVWSDKAPLFSDVLKIWGVSPTDVYVTDRGGKIYHFTGGTQWAEMAQQPKNTQPLYSIFGLDATTIYAGGGGTGNVALRWDSVGGNWVPMSIGTSTPAVTNPVIKTIWGYTGAPNNWWCGGQNFSGISNNGTSWTPKAVSNTNINGIWGTTDGSLIFGVGSYSSTGTPPIEHNIFRYNINFPNFWSWQFDNPPARNILLNAIWGTNNDFFAVGEGGVILHYHQ